MLDTTVTTVIVNASHEALTMKVGSRHCYAKLTSFKVGDEYRLELDVNWAYQEFLVQGKSDAANRLFLSSDDCCDCERITIEEKPDGKLAMHTLLRSQFRSQVPCSVILEEAKEPAEESQQTSGIAMEEKKESAEESQEKPVSMMGICKVWVCRFCRTRFLA